MNDHSRTASIPTDMEELANDDANQEIMFTLLGSGEGVLDQIEAAIRRVEGGGYGCCERCGQPISETRLDALPYAAECVRCAWRAEQYANA